MLKDNRIRIITGHYGSGKTEFAVNYAIKLADLYCHHRKYKNSSFMYQKALEYQFSQKSITYLEEL